MRNELSRKFNYNTSANCSSEKDNLMNLIKRNKRRIEINGF